MYTNRPMPTVYNPQPQNRPPQEACQSNPRQQIVNGFWNAIGAGIAKVLLG
jgi:hypothetical protein